MGGRLHGGLLGPQEVPVVRYSSATLNAERGWEFQVAEFLNERHQTPFGAMQPFCYARFTRLS